MWEPARSAGDHRCNQFHEHDDEIVENPKPAGGSRCCSSFAGMAAPDEPGASKHPAFRTAVEVCELRVTGVLPGTPRPSGGVIAISGDVRRLSSDQALELVDALLLVVTRMDVVAEERDGAATAATHDRED
jgi:hypothetical protein